jgi:hypothetical protein
MACDVTKGKLEIACKDAAGGYKAVYLANYAEYDFTTSSSDATGHILTDLGTLTEVYKFAAKNTANTYDQTINSNRDNGTTTYTQVLNLTLTKLTPEMEYQVRMMSLGRPIIFLELNSGEVLALGLENGTEVAGKSAIGGTIDSFAGYQLSATGTETQPHYFLDESAISSLKALVSAENLS